MHKPNWDDLRYVLAVADHRSVNAAARSLGVNHATVLRRVAAFEERHGEAIFRKTPRGYEVLPERGSVIEALREVESAALAVGRALEGVRDPLSGTVRVTSTDTLCTSILPQAVAQVRANMPSIRVELLCSNSHLDLGRLDADVAVRPTEALPEDLVGRSAGLLRIAAYTAKQESLQTWLGLSGAIGQSRAGRWMRDSVPSDQVQDCADSFVTLHQMARAGPGRTLLPTYLGDADPVLKRLDIGVQEAHVPLWIATHRDFENVPRIRAFCDHLTRALAAQLA